MTLDLLHHSTFASGSLDVYISKKRASLTFSCCLVLVYLAAGPRASVGPLVLLDGPSEPEM